MPLRQPDIDRFAAAVASHATRFLQLEADARSLRDFATGFNLATEITAQGLRVNEPYTKQDFVAYLTTLRELTDFMNDTAVAADNRRELLTKMSREPTLS